MSKHAAVRLWLGSGLALLLAACGQSNPSGQADPYAGGITHPWSYTAQKDRVTALSLTPGENNLYFEPILAARNAWGPIEVDRSNGEQHAGDGKALTLNGQTYQRGFGTHAGSELRYSLKGTGATCTRFTADIGVDDEVGNRGSVVFQVYLGGEKAYDSGTMTGASQTKHVDLDVTGQQELRLVVTDAGNGISYDHANWAIPKVYCQTSEAPTLTLNQNSVSIYHLHTTTLKANFRNLTGTVDLRLEVAPGKTTGLNLQTTRVELPEESNGPVTRDVIIRADGLPQPPFIYDPEPLVASYWLVASQDGSDVASVPVTITEKLLDVSAFVEPQELSGRLGDTRRVTVTLTVSPPLDEPEPLSLRGRTSEDDHFTVQSVGPLSGDGGTMRQDFEITQNDFLPVGPYQAYYIVEAGVISGYRLPHYGDNVISLAWKVLP